MTTTPDLRAVDVLCALALAARRLSCRVLVVDASSELRELIHLVGVGDVLLDDRSDGPDRDERPDPPSPTGDLP